jgi:uncharacterized protein (DUF2062 family)/2-polyprenyl-3-methyl-5-hydroxy-6-metoxy-1,4-benzoquinol methylase
MVAADVRSGARGRRRWPWSLLDSIRQRLLYERSSPARLGWAVTVGVIIGTTPLYGFHLALSLVLATIFGLNRTITYLAANLPTPAFAPLIALGSIQLGALVARGEFLPLTLEAARQLDPWDAGKLYLGGSLVLGALLGAPLGIATAITVASYRRRHPLAPDPFAVPLQEVASRYRDQGRFAHGYVQGKLEHDPVYRQIAERCPLPGPVVDLGCGRGQTGILLALVQPGVRVRGLDWDAAKIAGAARAASGLDGLVYERADVRDAALDPGRAGTVLLLDVLHYQPIPEQDRILARAVEALTPAGVLYVREIDFEAGWRARVTTGLEYLGRWLRLNRGATLNFRPVASMVAQLESRGLAVSVEPSSEGILFSNVLIEARRTTATET